jgi:NADH:ubiquinone oxidoreductase subunit 3 (subunit A)
MRLYIYRHNPDNEKSSSYECGFFPNNDAPIKHEISFYTVGLTFLIFDLELLLIFPFVFSIIYATTVSS